jgi:hypothetical protein
MQEQQSSRIGMMMLSPYYFTTTEKEDGEVQRLEQQLLLSSLPLVPSSPVPFNENSLPFSFVAENLERAYNSNTISLKENIAFNLIHSAIECGKDNPPLELLALLRICLPQYDNRSVYGFKTHRLLKSFAKALERHGGVSGRSASANLLAWIKRPIPVKQKKWVISMPEIAVAHAHALCFPHKLDATSQSVLSIRDIAALCQRLTNMYKEKHKEVVMASTGSKNFTITKVDKIAEVLATVIPYLDYLQCKILVRVLLRSVSMGIGVKTFSRALSQTHSLDKRLDYQMDLCRLGMAVFEGTQRDSPIRDIVCGVPFRSMTCEVVSSPYVMKWLFSREENIKSYLSPKDGKLIIHSCGKWFIPPPKRSSSRKKKYIDLDTKEMEVSDNTKKHIMMLREFKRQSHLFIDEKIAWGMVLSYILIRGADKDSFTFYFRGMKTIEDEDIEFIDGAVTKDKPSSLYQQFLQNITKENKKKKGNELLAAEKMLEKLVISSDSHIIRNRGGLTIAFSACTNDFSIVSTSSKKDSGMIVQRKYDGDRMQAHLRLGQDGKHKVQLFSKGGKPVQHLYTDVANDFYRKLTTDLSASRELPCILDGEIIVVDADQKPLPWSSTKWRYDSGTSLESIQSPASSTSSHPTIVTIVNERGYCENLDDGEDSTLTFASMMALKSCDQIGSNEKKKMKVKILDGAQLLFVAFDIVMFKGRVVTEQPYSERLGILKSLNTLSNMKYSKAISESKYIHNAQSLIVELEKTVTDKAEGLILKDPRAKYVFGRTNTQRKLKICGPDINCGVAGVGFTVSKNPRMWGILTVIWSEDKSEFMVYNRVESIEGDAPSTAVEHILSLPSCVPLDSLNGKEVDLGKYIVSILHGEGSIIRVTWKSKKQSAEDMDDLGCTMCFMQGFPQDIHWLCNPLECLFGVSQRGDLHPLVWKGAKDQSIYVPRFPVCRIQLDDLQRSECDTPTTIISKFEQACAEPTCIQEFLKRRVVQLRCKPPRAEKLEELRRILLGKENVVETWPQKLDSMYKLQDFDLLLESNGFEPLTRGERSVLGGLQTISQWDQMLVKKIPIIESEETITMIEKRNASLPFLATKLERFKKLRLTAPIVSSIFPVNEIQKTIDEDKKEKIYSDMVFTLPVIPSELQDSIPFNDEEDKYSSGEDEEIISERVSVQYWSDDSSDNDKYNFMMGNIPEEDDMGCRSLY